MADTQLSNAPSMGPQEAAPPIGRKRRVAWAAVLYFAAVFAVGLALGPVRVLWLEPWIGQTLAVLCEAPFLIAAMAIAARLAPRWAGMQGGWIAHVWVGVLALSFQQIADLAVGFGLRGMTIKEELAYFATPPGWIYSATLIVFALAPLAAHLRGRRSPPS
jgi:hypothetical protein